MSARRKQVPDGNQGSAVLDRDARLEAEGERRLGGSARISRGPVVNRLPFPLPSVEAVPGVEEEEPLIPMTVRVRQGLAEGMKQRALELGTDLSSLLRPILETFFEHSLYPEKRDGLKVPESMIEKLDRVKILQRKRESLFQQVKDSIPWTFFRPKAGNYCALADQHLLAMLEKVDAELEALTGAKRDVDCRTEINERMKKDEPARPSHL